MKPPQKPATFAIAFPTARRLREIAHESSNAADRLPAGSSGTRAALDRRSPPGRAPDPPCTLSRPRSSGIRAGTATAPAGLPPTRGPALRHRRELVRVRRRVLRPAASPARRSRSPIRPPSAPTIAPMTGLRSRFRREVVAPVAEGDRREENDVDIHAPNRGAAHGNAQSPWTRTPREGGRVRRRSARPRVAPRLPGRAPGGRASGAGRPSTCASRARPPCARAAGGARCRSARAR